MKKEEIIQKIELLYPPDSDFPGTNKVGSELLNKAIMKEWKSLPIEILNTFLKFCMQREMMDRKGY
ncbi:MAG: hypothetical protein JSW62_04810 [Thermoplasmatales archaeon]|nr:MAG: hypothetical protein JSW62_04810 [Thermoplasmatales archaeon]